MGAFTFDTLKLAERLQSGGFSLEQARTMSSAFSETVGDWFAAQQLATKADIEHLKAGIEQLRLSTKADTEQLRLSTKADTEHVKADIEQLRLSTKADLAEAKADIIKWVVGIGFAQVAMVVALLKLASHF